MDKFIKAILRKEALDFLEKFQEICDDTWRTHKKSRFVCRVILSCETLEQYLSATEWSKKVYCDEEPFDVHLAAVQWIINRQSRRNGSSSNNDQHHHQRLSDAAERKFNFNACHGQGEV